MMAQTVGRAGFRRVLYGPSHEPRTRQNAREWHDLSNHPQSGAMVTNRWHQKAMRTVPTLETVAMADEPRRATNQGRCFHHPGADDAPLPERAECRATDADMTA